MKKSALQLFLGTIFFSSIACSAQDYPEPIYQKVLPGDASMQAERIRPHEVNYKKFGGSMFYDMQRITVAGKELYRLYIYFNYDGSGTPDTIYFNSETLAYTGRFLQLEDYTIDVSVSEGHFTGALIPAEGSDRNAVVYDKLYPHGAFEPAVINYFISALPLSEGYTASIPVFDLNNGSQLLWSNIEVLGKETLTIDGTEFETWKVHSQGIRDKTVWVSTSEPYAVRMETKGMFGAWEVKL